MFANCRLYKDADKLLSPVYTIQPVVKPVVKPTVKPLSQPVVSCIQTFKIQPVVKPV